MKLQKTIKISELEAIKALLYIRFNITSPTEINAVNELLIASGGQPMALSKEFRSAIEKKISGFSTILGRIEKTGAIIRQGKNIVFHPVFSNWDNVGQILFKIESKEE